MARGRGLAVCFCPWRGRALLKNSPAPCPKILRGELLLKAKEKPCAGLEFSRCEIGRQLCGIKNSESEAMAGRCIFQNFFCADFTLAEGECGALRGG